MSAMLSSRQASSQGQARSNVLQRIFTFLVSVFFALSVSHSAAQDDPITLEDFDGETGLGQRWTALGKIQVRRVDVPEGTSHEGVQGRMVTATADANGKLAVRADFPRPAWSTAKRIQLRLRAANASEEQPLVVEFQVFSSQRRAWFWRKITLDDSDWETVELPLRYFRQSPGAVVAWQEAHRFAIHFRNAGTLSIDNIELVPGKGQHPAWLSAQELGEFAFGDEAAQFSSDHFIVVTNEPQLDGKAVLAAFEKLYGMLRRDLPEMPAPRRRVVCLIFADRSRFQTFWRDLGQRFNSTVPIVRTGGYSIFGVAGSSYDDSFGPVRPVYVQEACHALLGQTLGISNQSEWLHEGLANYYQLHWSGQDIHEVTCEMIDKKRHIPLSTLLNGKSIGTRNYAQATLFVKYLMSDRERRRQFWSAMQSMKSGSSTALAPLCQEHFGQPLEDVEKAWLKWAQVELESQ